MNLLRHVASRHARFVLSLGVLLGAFQFLICAAVSSVNVGGALETLVRSLPPLFQNLVASQLLGGFSPSGLIAFGWNHPVAHALGAAIAIVLATRAIAGAIELLLSQPLSRRSYFGGHVVFAVLSVVSVSALGILGTALGQRVFGMERFGIAALLRLAGNYAALQAAVYGITLLVSSFGREAGPVSSTGYLLVVLSYFAEAIGRIWSRAAWILPWTLHDYFRPQTILVDQGGILRPLAVLGAVALAGASLAWARFRTRDLP